VAEKPNRTRPTTSRLRTRMRVPPSLVDLLKLYVNSGR
jgi:hypothetical protein